MSAEATNLDPETLAKLERLRQAAAAREAVKQVTARINARQKRKASGGNWIALAAGSPARGGRSGEAR